MEGLTTYEAHLRAEDGPGSYVLKAIWINDDRFSGKKLRAKMIFAGRADELRDRQLRIAIRAFMIDSPKIGVIDGSTVILDYTRPMQHPESQWLFQLEKKSLHRGDIVEKLHEIAHAWGYTKIDRLTVDHSFRLRVKTPSGIKIIPEGDYLLQKHREVAFKPVTDQVLYCSYDDGWEYGFRRKQSVAFRLHIGPGVSFADLGLEDGGISNDFGKKGAMCNIYTYFLIAPVPGRAYDHEVYVSKLPNGKLKIREGSRSIRVEPGYGFRDGLGTFFNFVFGS